MTDYAYLIARLTRMGLDYDIDWATHDQRAYPRSVHTSQDRWWFKPDGSTDPWTLQFGGHDELAIHG